MSTSKRGRVRPTHAWSLLLPLFEWPEQERYEQIRPLVLFDDVAVAEGLGDVGWHKALRLEDYAAMRARRPSALQPTRFPYHEA